MKRTILLVGLGIAFVGASLWVMLSAGRSAKAIRAKFRLGGAILTLVSLTSLVSCEKGGGVMVSCYDPVSPPHNEIHINAQQGAEYRNGDAIVLYYGFDFDADVALKVLSEEEAVLQEEVISLKSGDNYLNFKIEVGDYRGKAMLRITHDVYEGLSTEHNYEFVIVE